MIDTNALLVAAFGIITQFHAVVPPRNDYIPSKAEDVQRLVVGSPLSPVDFFILSRDGASYSFRRGSLYRYETINSSQNMQEPSEVSRWMGHAILTSNQAVSLANSAIVGLMKRGQPVTNGPAWAKKLSAGGESIPFYLVAWPSTNSAFKYAAAVEVDARDGKITYVNLRDECFRDVQSSERFSNLVHHSDAPRETQHAMRPRFLGVPNTNAVVQGIGNWLKICALLGIDLGKHTNITDVDWERTGTLTNEWLGRVVLRVGFQDGGAFDSVDGAMISATAYDKYFRTERRVSSDFSTNGVRGVVNVRWDVLAGGFERILTNKFGIAPGALKQFDCIPTVGGASIGSTGQTRVVVSWMRTPPLSAPKGGILQPRPGFAVEFDTQTGKTKGFAFYDRLLTDLFCQAQGQSFEK